MERQDSMDGVPQKQLWDYLPISIEECKAMEARSQAVVDCLPEGQQKISAMLWREQYRLRREELEAEALQCKSIEVKSAEWLE